MRSQFERGLDTLTEYFLDEQGNRIGERSRSLGSDVDIRAVDVIWYDGVPTAETTTEEYSSRYLNSDRRGSKKVEVSTEEEEYFNDQDFAGLSSKCRRSLKNGIYSFYTRGFVIAKYNSISNFWDFWNTEEIEKLERYSWKETVSKIGYCILSDMREAKETKSSRMTREEGENLAKELGLDSSVFWFNVSLMGLDLESLDYVRHTFSNRGF